MTTPATINIVSATQVGDHLIRLRFDDGTGQDVDFKPFIVQSRHPDIRAFLDQQRFASYRIENGELVWGDYELCFPVIDLYRNQLSHAEHHAVAA
jgi:hypothetical protein